MGILFTFVVFVLVVGLIAAGVFAMRRWRGAWRWLALAALLPVLAVAGKIVVDVTADPTSHNLWPFELLVALAVGFALLGGVQLVRMVVGRFS